MFNINIFKKGHKTLETGLETWVVRWNVRHGEFSSDYKETAQFFADKEEAKEFEDSLKRATKLLGHTSHHLTWTVCEKVQKHGL
ncbi:hypothetical protein Kirov_143 [Bacillus phage Kirov]|uniref:Uncharacterized protein n=1 Tax=Bacillus phage Kirov TaxID=2783539 RepID=A0A7U3RZ19_9CAUD|nr:hypothetical protein PQE67_gp161 [Bacillus phage Kirov]QOV08342.1 hypothetical protein Kirov_143 [Bacillus phage Kirov]